MADRITVEGWVLLFREIGLNDAQMQHWHILFEQRFPESHQSFLQWLGLPPERIRSIRSPGV